MLVAQKFEPFSFDLLEFNVIEFRFRNLVVFWHKLELGNRFPVQSR